MSNLNLRVGLPVPKPSEPLTEEEIISGWDSENQKPLVSVMCHCFNHEDFIKDALNSILMQKTNFNFEIIVHDDASTDSSAEIIKQYTDRYPSIIKPIFQKENQYSRGLKPTFFTSKMAKGEFIAICEGDDFWLDEKKLQIQADFLRNNSKYSVCGHDAFVFEGQLVSKISKLPESSKTDVSALRLSKGWFILTLTVMFRNKIDLYPKESPNVLNGDTFLFSRLGKIGGYKYMSEIVPGGYRVHSGGIWSLVDQQKKYAQSMNSMYWISQYYKRKGDYKLSSHFAKQSALQSLKVNEYLTLSDLLGLNYSLIKRIVIKKRGGFYNLLKGARNSK